MREVRKIEMPRNAIFPRKKTRNFHAREIFMPRNFHVIKYLSLHHITLHFIIFFCISLGCLVVSFNLNDLEGMGVVFMRRGINSLSTDY